MVIDLLVLQVSSMPFYILRQALQNPFDIPLYASMGMFFRRCGLVIILSQNSSALFWNGVITGVWQVSGGIEITNFEEVVKPDTQYINEWSIGLDSKILLKTVLTVLKRDGSM